MPRPPRVQLLVRRALAGLTGVVAVAVLSTVPPTHAPAARAVAADTDPQVLVVSLDGFNPTVLRSLGREGLPHLWRLFDEGAGTLAARTQVEMTVTLPNHTSMVTGRRIDARYGGHGVTWNDNRLTPRTVQAAARHTVASLFSRVHFAGGSTALYAAKTKFGLWNRSWPRAIDRTGIYDENDQAVIAQARTDLVARDRALTFVHLGGADKTGHVSGWLSPDYLDAVRELDRLVGLVLADAGRSPALDDLTIILTADHGGVAGSTDHSDAQDPADFTVPFVVWGRGVRHADLYALNPGYVRPVSRQQPDLVGRQPVRNGDVANLALSLLGNGPVPGSLFGRTRPLRVS